MGVEVRPYGVRCNIACQYCYQNPERDAGNVLESYDLDKMIGALEESGKQFTLFGGEPLIMPVVDLEKLFAYGFEKHQKNGIQTNGVLIDDEHVRLFKQYKVQVGISVDGPGELNDVRWAGNLEDTREATAKTHAAIERLASEGIPPSIIITLHRNNATADKLPAMHAWIRHLEELGVPSARLHLLEVEDPSVGGKYALSTEENLVAMRSFHQLEGELETLKLDVFEDIRRLLAGDDGKTTCVWNACDSYTTAAVEGLEGQGQRSNCGRTNKEGIDFVKAGRDGYERYIGLYNTPWEHGGCQDCRFFMMCKGQCPGTAIDGDFRNRTEHCEVWMGLFDDLEAEMVTAGKSVPLSLHPERRRLEKLFLEVWGSGRNATISHLLKWEEKRDRPLELDPEAVELEEKASIPQAVIKSPPPGEPKPYGLDRLDDSIPDFTRLSWVSDSAREVWEPRIERVTKAWQEIEWRSVAQGLRRCNVTVCSPENLPEFAGTLAREGLSVLPLEMEGQLGAGYSNVAQKPVAGQPFVYRVALGSPTDIGAFQTAWEAADQHAIGDLLGYPECCREFFHEVWVEHRLRDTTWPMALRSLANDSAKDSAKDSDNAEPRMLEISGPAAANIMWRWANVRLVSHLPCSAHCEATVALAEAVVDLGRSSGLEQEIDWALEMLDWPIEWSARHGIAEVRTPILKIVACTDATASTFTVRRMGVGYPPEGARGLRFPYRQPPQPLLTASRSFKQGLENPLPVIASGAG